MIFLSDRMLFIRSSLIVQFLTVACLLTITTSSYGQQTNVDTNTTNYWVHGGTSINNLGVGIQGGLSVDYNQHVFSLRTVSTDMSYGAEIWDIALVVFHLSS